MLPHDQSLYHAFLIARPLGRGQVIPRSGAGTSGNSEEGLIFRTDAEDWLLLAAPHVTEETLRTITARAVAYACEPGHREVKPAVICEEVAPGVRNAAVRLRIPLFAIKGAGQLPEGLCGVCGGNLTKRPEGAACPRCHQHLPRAMTLRTCSGCLLQYASDPQMEEALHEKLTRAGQPAPLETLCPNCRSPGGAPSGAMTLLDEMAQALVSQVLSTEDLSRWGLPPAYLRLVNLRAQRLHPGPSPRASS